LYEGQITLITDYIVGPWKGSLSATTVVVVVTGGVVTVFGKCLRLC